jgi:hypothetical protein
MVALINVFEMKKLNDNVIFLLKTFDTASKEIIFVNIKYSLQLYYYDFINQYCLFVQNNP